MSLNPLTLIKLILILFICVGLGLTLFMIAQEARIIGGYVVAISFILGPGLLLYGLTVGFGISKKTIRKTAERQEIVTFDPNGISYKLPLFQTTQFINWETIDKIVYTNYQSDEHAQFIFHLTQPPIQTMSENPWWINRLFPFAFRNKKEITIEGDCKNFEQIPEMVNNYLGSTSPIDLTEDYRKGRLVSSNVTINNSTITTEENWKPKNHEREKVIYDRYDQV